MTAHRSLPWSPHERSEEAVLRGAAVRWRHAVLARAEPAQEGTAVKRACQEGAAARPPCRGRAARPQTSAEAGRNEGCVRAEAELVRRASQGAGAELLGTLRQSRQRADQA